MLTFIDRAHRPLAAPDLGSGDISGHFVRVEAQSPTPEEIMWLERAFAAHMPKAQRLQEIETSSRLYVEGSTVVIALPKVVFDAHGLAETAIVAYLLGKKALLRLRYDPPPPTDPLAVVMTGGADGDGVDAALAELLGCLEAMVDRLADLLENVIADLDGRNRRILIDSAKSRGRKANEEAFRRRATLADIGKLRRTTNKIGESLIALTRVKPFLLAVADDRLDGSARHRLDRIAEDVRSLYDHQSHLGDGVQFLLDATLGMIGVDQNEIFKILTMASVVGIPPTLIAGIYGMNFKNMPEYDWSWGYQYGLALLAISAIVPLVWFKLRSWW